MFRSVDVHGSLLHHHVDVAFLELENIKMKLPKGQVVSGLGCDTCQFNGHSPFALPH